MAVKYYAGNKLTGVASDTKPTSNIIDGSTFFVTDTEDLYMYDLGSTSWKIVSGNTIAETLSNKTYSDHITVAEISAPSTPASGYGAIYAKSDNKLYFKNDAGTEIDLTNQASGGETNQNAWNTISVSGQDNVVADSATDTFTLAAGSNITLTTNASSDTVTIAASSGGATNLTGLSDVTIASAADAHILLYDNSDSRFENKAISGDIAITAAGATTIQANAVEGTMLNANTVDDSSIQLASNTLNVKAAGITGTMLNANVVDDSSLQLASNTLNIKASGVTNTMLAGGIGNSKLANQAIIVSDGSNTSGVALGATLTFAATANETTVVENAGTVTIGLPNNVTIAGNLIVTGNSTVNGDTVTQNVATVSVEDPLMALASGNNAADAVDIGFYGLYDTSGSQDLYAGLFRDANDSGKWKLFKDLQATPTTTVNTSGTGYAAGTLVAALEGNATTATTLATARTIGGTSFDGSANIAVALAATATTLASARTIGGTSFDGSANIVPATITVADTTDTSSFVALFESATGDLAPKTDAGITYNAGTGTLTATAFVGPITDNVTGNASGTAASVTGGTQAAITAAANLVTVGTIGTGVWQGTAVAQTYIADQAINEAKLQVSNAPTNGYLLTARSGNAGGMTWEASSAAGASESFAIAMAVAL